MLRNRFIFVSMMIELLCRYARPKSEDSEKDSEDFKEKRNIEKVIKLDDFDEEAFRREYYKGKKIDMSAFQYAPHSFDTDDIKSFNYAAPEHTCIRFKDGDAFTYNIDYLTFQTIYTTLTGKSVNNLSNIVFKLEEDDQPKDKLSEDDQIHSNENGDG